MAVHNSDTYHHGDRVGGERSQYRRGPPLVPQRGVCVGIHHGVGSYGLHDAALQLRQQLDQGSARGKHAESIEHRLQSCQVFMCTFLIIPFSLISRKKCL